MIILRSDAKSSREDSIRRRAPSSGIYPWADSTTDRQCRMVARRRQISRGYRSIFDSLRWTADLLHWIRQRSKPGEKWLDHLSRKFWERSSQQVLGEIGFKFRDRLSLPESDFMFFEPRTSTNYCLVKTHLAAHYLLFAYKQWRKDNTKGVHLSFLERRAMMVQFIRPHPVMLVSIGNREKGNIFPMNLLGDLGNGYFGLALRTERVVGGLVERYGRVALSSMPLSQGAVAYQLGHNHSRQSFDWGQLPFAMRMSTTFHIPVPAFALRIRELEIKEARAVGSHTFFLAR